MDNIFWIAIVAWLVLLAQGLFLGGLSLRKLSYERSFSKATAYEGETIEMIEVISNRKIFPVPWLRVESRIPRELAIVGQREEGDVAGELYHRSPFTLSPYQKITRRHKILCTHRGFYTASSATITSGDLFNLNTNARGVDTRCTVAVYPAPVDVDDVPLPSLKYQGELVVRRYILPDTFLYGGIRDYVVGDPMKSVHWGASAATGSLKVKQHDYTASPKLLILLNVQPKEDVWGDISKDDAPYIEYGIRVAASLAEKLIENGIEVGFATNGRAAHGVEETVFVAPAATYEHHQALLDTMARMEVVRQRSFHMFMDELPTFKEYDVLIMSCYRSELIESAAADMAARGNSVGYFMLKEGA